MSLSVTMSGMKVAQKSLDVLGNNLANAGTDGFKRSVTSFADVFPNDPSASPKTAVGQGAVVANITRDTSQGSMQNTGKVTDLAISGSGFFTLSAGGNQIYTRAGNFQVDKNGNLSDASGNMVQMTSSANAIKWNGTSWDYKVPNSIASADLKNVNIPFGINYGAAQTPITLYSSFTAGTGGNPDTFLPSSGAVDADGNAMTLANIPISVPNPPTVNPGTVVIDSKTYYYDVVTNATQINDAIAKGPVAATNPPNSATDGLLQSLSIDSNGLIQGSYSGLQIPFPIGYLAIANFPNPGALQPIGNTDFAASGGSGDVALSAGGSPGTGTVMSGSLEASNVDMTNELVQMIKAQQLYNGNARALQTQVEVASRVTDKL